MVLEGVHLKVDEREVEVDAEVVIRGHCEFVIDVHLVKDEEENLKELKYHYQVVS